MSGYADDALAQYELDPTTVFLRKPFTPAVLARTVRNAIDARRVDSEGRAQRRTECARRRASRAACDRGARRARGRAAPPAHARVRFCPGYRRRRILVDDREFEPADAQRRRPRASVASSSGVRWNRAGSGGLRVRANEVGAARTDTDEAECLRGPVWHSLRGAPRARVRRAASCSRDRHVCVAPFLESESAHRHAGRVSLSIRSAGGVGRRDRFDYRAAMVSLPPITRTMFRRRQRVCARRSAADSRRSWGFASAGRARPGRISTRATRPCNCGTIWTTTSSASSRSTSRIRARIPRDARRGGARIVRRAGSCRPRSRAAPIMARRSTR